MTEKQITALVRRVLSRRFWVDAPGIGVRSLTTLEAKTLRAEAEKRQVSLAHYLTQKDREMKQAAADELAARLNRRRKK